VPLAKREAVDLLFAAIAEQEAVRGELSLHGGEGAADAGIRRREEVDLGQEQQARANLHETLANGPERGRVVGDTKEAPKDVSSSRQGPLDANEVPLPCSGVYAFPWTLAFRPASRYIRGGF
jgi:hypothetical protein